MPPDTAPGNEDADGNGNGNGKADAKDATRTRPTLNSAVRRRRTDRAFYMRLAGAIRQNDAALKRLAR